MDVLPRMDHFDNPSGDFADDVAVPDMLLPPGWENHPNWDSDMSIWAMLKGPEDTKTSSKKHKKQAHDSEHQSYGLLAVYEKVTRDYLARLLTNTIDNEALATEVRSVCHAYDLQTAEQVRNMVVPTPQFGELLLYPKYKGEGELLPHGDPPLPMMGHLPRPLGRSVPRNAEWYNVCPLEDIRFKELH
jgi:hypothetical protein